ncbi:MAG TPA: YigZ family protein [Candidatus Krumholzibacteria bacterium]|nr:YigZ family protein [Candidatus Krumholzibacteria bacterium]
MTSHAPSPDEPESTPSIEDGEEIELRIKGSRFLAQAFHVEDVELVNEKLTHLRRRYHDASHHCWAARLKSSGSLVERSDDDGEPSGTAGVPILGALQRAKLYDAFVVVTRYFGGTKLGRGGLVRAYSDAARSALEIAPRKRIWHDAFLTVECSFEDLGTVEAQLARSAAAVKSIERDFSGTPRLHLRIRRSKALRVAEEIREATGARARLSWQES